MLYTLYVKPEDGTAVWAIDQYTITRSIRCNWDKYVVSVTPQGEDGSLLYINVPGVCGFVTDDLEDGMLRARDALCGGGS